MKKFIFNTMIPFIFVVVITCAILGNPVLTRAESQVSDVVLIPDANLEKAIRAMISKPVGDILKSDLLSIKDCNLKTLDIKSLEGLQYARNIKSLTLTENKIEDISQISELKNLTSLSLNSNFIKDISPLAELLNLNSINLCDNKVSDLKSLRNLNKLEALDITRNPISDLSQISALKNSLKSLTANQCNIENLSFLSDFELLESVSLADNKILDLPSMNKLKMLKEISLSNNLIEDFSELLQISSLNEVGLNGNPIADYSRCNEFGDNTKCNFWGFYMSKSEIEDFLAKADKILADIIKPEMTLLEKEKAVHDYICLNTEYKLGVSDKGAYGVIVDHKGACDAISDATSLLLKRAGVEVIKVSHGWAGQAHAWNMVKIGGRYYHLDCTWDIVDSRNGNISYEYFNVDDVFLLKEGRTWDRSKYPIATDKKEGIVAYKDDIIKEYWLKNSSKGLPKNVQVYMADGTIAEVPVTWSKSTIDSSVPGQYTLLGTVEGYDEKITLNLYISQSDQLEIIGLDYTYMYKNLPQYSKVDFPEKIKANMNDGSTIEVPIIWNSTEIDTTIPGVYEFVGSIANCKFTINYIVTVFKIQTQIVSIEPAEINTTVGQGSTYELPKTAKAKMSDGTTKEVALTWTPATVDTAIAGNYEYTAAVQGYNGTVKLYLEVKAQPVIIVSIEPAEINASVEQGSNYELPKTVTAKMSDGTTKEAALTWTPATVDTAIAGTFEYTAAVQGYNGTVKLYLEVKAQPVTIVSIEPTEIDATVEQGFNYELPKTVTARMSDGTTKEAALTWTPATVDTAIAGTYEYTAAVQGYNGSVKLHLVVKSKQVQIVKLEYTNLYYTADKGENYTLPKSITAKMSDGTTKEVVLTWTPALVDTSVPGDYIYRAFVEGYDGSVKAYIKVIEK